MLSIITKTHLATGIALAATVSLQVPAALGDDWLADRLRGSVFVYQNEEWMPLERGDIVSDDSYIKTFGDGRITLVRGAERIELAGHTMVQIFDKDGSKFTNVHQHYGEVAVEAEEQNVEHFAVVTPYLAAVVKGTEFVVKSGSAGSNVSVDRGEVNVADPQTGTNVDIIPGQTAGIDPQGIVRVAASGGAELPVVHDASGEALPGQQADNSMSSLVIDPAAPAAPTASQSANTSSGTSPAAYTAVLAAQAGNHSNTGKGPGYDGNQGNGGAGKDINPAPGKGGNIPAGPGPGNGPGPGHNGAGNGHGPASGSGQGNDGSGHVNGPGPGNGSPGHGNGHGSGNGGPGNGPGHSDGGPNNGNGHGPGNNGPSNNGNGSGDGKGPGNHGNNPGNNGNEGKGKD